MQSKKEKLEHAKIQHRKWLESLGVRFDRKASNKPI
jgi:hypothetical protein